MATSRREYRWREKPSTDKTNQTFGMLTVVGFSHYELKNGIQKGRKLIWDCLCKCEIAGMIPESEIERVGMQ